MGFDVKVITELTAEPVLLSEVKTHLRIDEDYTDEDTLIVSFIKVAREQCEKYTQRSFGTKTLELILDDFPAEDYITLRKPPVQSLTSIKYKDSASTETTWSSSNYILNADIYLPKVYLGYGLTWPSFTPYPTGAVRVRYTAGYTTDLPESIKAAMLLMIGDLYENRENSGEKQLFEIPFSCKALLNPYRTEFF